MKKSELLEFNFKKKQENKEIFFYNKELDIKLKHVGIDIYEYDEYENVETKERVSYYTELMLMMAKKEIAIDSEFFKKGLPEKNINQGDFATAYKDKTKGLSDNWFMTFAEAKKLLEAQFNRYISSNLMLSNSKPNFDYKITETYFTFSINEGLTVKNRTNQILKLYYKYVGFNHTFYQVIRITSYMDKKANYPVSERHGLYIPHQLILDSFIK